MRSTPSPAAASCSTKEDLVRHLSRRQSAGSAPHTAREDGSPGVSPAQCIVSVVETVAAWKQLGIPEEETLLAIEMHRGQIRHALPQPLTTMSYLNYRLDELHCSMSSMDLASSVAESRAFFEAEGKVK